MTTKNQSLFLQKKSKGDDVYLMDLSFIGSAIRQLPLPVHSPP